MTPEEVKAKVAKCKALKGKTLEDIINTRAFLKNLTAYLKAQKEDRDNARQNYETIKKLGGVKGMKLPAHPIDNIDLTPERFKQEYLQVFALTNPRPSSERKYIEQLGNQALRKTMADMVCKEFPELTDYYFPKKNDC